MSRGGGAGSGGQVCVAELSGGKASNAACSDCMNLLCASELADCLAGGACVCATWGTQTGQMNYMLECLANVTPGGPNQDSCAQGIGLTSRYQLSAETFALLDCLGGGAPPPPCGECFGKPTNPP